MRDGSRWSHRPDGAPDRLIGNVARSSGESAATTYDGTAGALRVEGELSFETRVRRVERIYSEMVPRA